MNAAQVVIVALAGCLGALPVAAQALRPVAAGDICVTNGAITPGADGRLAIETPSSRAVLHYPTAQAAEIRFTYLGPSAGSKPLASGEMRRQIGVKLRAQDTCNLVYAMWHIEPDARIAVSIKRNPGMNTHEQCDAHGYINLKAPTPIDLPRIAPGQSHVLRAQLQGSLITVTADGVVVWRGDLGPGASEFDGPVGLRTDNARFAFDFLAGPRGAGAAGQAKCAPAPDE